jgi:hypothetical protein
MISNAISFILLSILAMLYAFRCSVKNDENKYMKINNEKDKENLNMNINEGIN